MTTGRINQIAILGVNELTSGIAGPSQDRPQLGISVCSDVLISTHRDMCRPCNTPSSMQMQIAFGDASGFTNMQALSCLV
jgi:hypothetical protein